MYTIQSIDRVLTDRKKAEQNKVEAQKENVDPGFNLLSLISDIYYRENFHSDIIKAILDVNGKHGAGSKYLHKLIDLLNRQNLVKKIDHSYYTSETKVVREIGRRDITISGISNHAIIIENKINDARDTWNQIPTYVKQLEDNGKIVDAIMYLTLSQTKEPNEATWQVDNEKRKEIKSKLASVRAYERKQYDFCNGWLQECIKETNDIDSLSILRQYFKIIKYLTRNQMDHEFFHQLDSYLKEKPENAEVVISLNNNLKEYPKFILHNIFQHFNRADLYLPFKEIKTWSDSVYYLSDYRIAGCTFNSDIIIPNIDSCTIDISVRGEYAYQREHPEAVLETIGMLNKFVWDGRRFNHKIEGNFIKFEEKSIEFLTAFLDKLKHHEQEIEVKLKAIIDRNKPNAVNETHNGK